MRVFTLTMNPAIDQSASVEKVEPEHKLRCTEPRYDPGGGGINVARVLRRFGVPVTAVFPSGGVTGHVLVELVRREGLDFLAIPIAGTTRINVHIDEISTHAQYRFNMPGPRLNAEEVQTCIETFSNGPEPGDYAVLSGSLGPGVTNALYRDVARLVRERGARVILDSSGPALSSALEAGVWLLKPNLKELSHLTGSELRNQEDIAGAARQLIASGSAEAVVVSMARDGCLLVTSDESVSVAAPMVETVSRIGAGDSMVAGIVACLARGGSLLEAVQFGVAAGTAAVGEHGTQLCDPAVVERLYREMTT